MSNETKRDVFEDALAYAPVGREYDPVNDDEAGDLRSCLSVRYESALPDDLPVIPETVGEYIKRWKDDLLTELIFVIFLTIQHNINIDNPPDVKVENWIIDHCDTFARAWLLGVWRVEETGKIVKLEAEV